MGKVVLGFVVHIQLKNNARNIQRGEFVFGMQTLDDSATCASALNESYNGHDRIVGYLAGSTVNAVDANVTPTLQRFVAYKAYNTYTKGGQCKDSIEKAEKVVNILYERNGTTCANMGCLTAQETLNTSHFCKDYLTGYTLNTTDNCCVVTPYVCENKRKCFWDTTQASTQQRNVKIHYAMDHNQNQTETLIYLVALPTLLNLRPKYAMISHYQLMLYVKQHSLLVHQMESFALKEETAIKYDEVGCVTDIKLKVLMDDSRQIRCLLYKQEVLNYCNIIDNRA